MLYVFSGLPGSGKSTLAQELAKLLGFVYIRIDTIEQGLREYCHVNVESEGYYLSYKIAEDNLRLGTSVIADSCNAIALTRTQWADIAKKSAASWVDIEIACSEPSEHRRRVENRKPSIKGHTLPTWQQVVDREYHCWTSERLVIDTAGKSIEESFEELLSALNIKA